uniref:Uncharacterized protein n=1 Tax=Acrobeloides nanus TaxID=290746 RepID=A0A914E7C7_9BILA
MSLKGKVAVVTGASRGIGRGIALQLGQAGAKVYVTGREPKNMTIINDPKFPTLVQTAQEITKRGGQGIHVYTDHANDDQVKALFDRIDAENKGKLDILVNNAFAAIESDELYQFKKFWEYEPGFYDLLNNVGLRGHYVASVFAARLFVKHGQGGLIVNVSSAGAKKYFLNAPYGIGKAGLDRMTADTAIDLQPHNVAVVSIWPGPVRTEMVMKKADDDTLEFAATFKNFLVAAETPEYPGKAVVALAKDPKILDKTGKAFPTSFLGKEYGFKDIDDRELPVNQEFVELLKL